jgi:multidrug efflux system membrane fusion protein
MNYSEPPSKLNGLKLAAPRRLSPRVILAGIAVVLVAGFLFFRGGEQAGPGAGPGGGFGGGQGAPPVRIAQVESRDIPITAHTIGTVLANATVAVKSQIEGPLLSVAFKEGQLVQKGQVLFQIDPRPMEAALRQAEAQLARDRAQLASAQSDAERASMLAERGIVSTQQRDQIVANAKALSATEAADQAALERAQLNLSYTTIRAPIDGKTGPYLVHPGNLVRANDANGLVVINQIRPVKITFSMPQNQLPLLQDRLREGALVAALSVHSENAAPGSALSESELNVKVDFIGNLVDERTGTIELRATHQNDDLRLVPGELVDVSLRLDTLKNAVIVPRAAVIIGQDGGTYVWVLNQQDEADMRPARMQYQDEQIAAIGNVVRVGERVVIDGQLRLTPGVKVAIVQPGAVAAPAVPPQGGRAGARGARAGAGAGRRGPQRTIRQNSFAVRS